MTAAPSVAVPEGQLLKSRVVDDPRDPLAEALDRAVTGYVLLEPQEALLLDEGARGVVTLHDGVPRVAYHTGTGRGGPAALADLATPGPYRVELYRLAPAELAELTADPSLHVPPGAPAERLAGDPALASSTRRAAPADWTEGTEADGEADASEAGDGEDRGPGAVEAFLDDAEKIEAIREQAREEAKARAEEWGFPDCE